MTISLATTAMWHRLRRFDLLAMLPAIGGGAVASLACARFLEWPTSTSISIGAGVAVVIGEPFAQGLMRRFGRPELAAIGTLIWYQARFGVAGLTEANRSSVPLALRADNAAASTSVWQSFVFRCNRAEVAVAAGGDPELGPLREASLLLTGFDRVRADAAIAVLDVLMSLPRGKTAASALEATFQQIGSDIPAVVRKADREQARRAALVRISARIGIGICIILGGLILGMS